MGTLPKKWMAWITRLLPKQRNEGAGSVQVGKAGGDVTANTSINNRNVTIINVMAAAQDAPLALTTPEQREVLAMIRRLRNSESVYLFMERQFATRMVMDLRPGELLRVRRYVETINQKSRRDKA